MTQVDALVSYYSMLAVRRQVQCTYNNIIRHYDIMSDET